MQINISSFIDQLRGVSLKEKIMFTRNLGVMISAGLPLVKALELLSRQSQTPKFKNIISVVADDLKKGTSLADAFEKQPSVFSDLYINMIRVGEIGGTLDNSLKILAEQLKREHDLKSKIKGAMIYPAVIMSAVFVVGVLMMIFVVPQLASTFLELGIELPWTTQLVIGLSNFLQHFWYLFILIVLGIIFGLRTVLRTSYGKKFFDWLLLKTPIISSLTVKVNSAMFSRTLSSLIESGVAIVKSLEITANTLNNYYFRNSLKEAANMVQKGKTLTEILNVSPYFPLLLTQMAAVGEETGQLTNVLKQLALFYEEEVELTTKNLSSIIEPFIMIVIGGFIGFFAVSMIQPMYSMVNAI